MSESGGTSAPTHPLTHPIFTEEYRFFHCFQFHFTKEPTQLTGGSPFFFSAERREFFCQQFSCQEGSTKNSQHHERRETFFIKSSVRAHSPRPELPSFHFILVVKMIYSLMEQTAQTGITLLQLYFLQSWVACDGHLFLCLSEKRPCEFL